MWLFVPLNDMTTFAASAFAPVSEDWISDCISRCPDIELFALSSETLTPRRLSWRGWRTRPWLRLLSGTICDPLTADRGAAAFISSLPVILASPSRSRACAKARTTPATYGRKSRASQARSSRPPSSSRMSPAISPSASKTSPETFRTWATGLQRASYQRRKSAGRIPARGCSFWATPTFKGSGNRACIQLSPAGLAFRIDQNQTGSQLGLKNQVVSWTLLRQLLDAAGWTGDRFRSSHPNRVILLNGEKHSERGLTLNPAFTDWLMGWPVGWTEPLKPVTGWSHWLQQGRSATLPASLELDDRTTDP